MKRIRQALSLALLTLLCGCAKEDVGIIGGADGPTAVFVATSTSTPDTSGVIWIVLLALLLAILAVLAIVLIRKHNKHK